MAELRAVVAGRFDLAIELGKAEDGDAEFASEALQTARNAGDLFLPRVARVIGLDKLQIVDHDERETGGRTLEATGGRRDFGHVAAGRIVDKERGAAYIGGGLNEATAVFAGELAVA